MGTVGNLLRKSQFGTGCCQAMSRATPTGPARLPPLRTLVLGGGGSGERAAAVALSIQPCAKGRSAGRGWQQQKQQREAARVVVGGLKGRGRGAVGGGGGSGEGAGGPGSPPPCLWCPGATSARKPLTLASAPDLKARRHAHCLPGSHIPTLLCSLQPHQWPLYQVCVCL